MTTTWVAGFRSAVLDSNESIQIKPSRGFRDQTVRQILHLNDAGARAMADAVDLSYLRL
ncbi:hypothetical protein [Embleya sp. NPDC005575]|uniref:hypothetical protein n=1 Tax=Embleya sp. NPDC005575 TaxID=3156892 RepID=UPI0033ACDBE5